MNGYEKAGRIIKSTEDLCGLPVRVVWDDSLLVGAIVHLSEIDWAKQVRISVKPGRQDTDYLVALQCGMAMKFCQNKNESKNLTSCEGSLEKTIEEFMQLGLSLEVATQTTNQIVPGLGQQLRGSAPQLILSTWIHSEFPELRKSQLIHHHGEVNTSYASLKIDKSHYPKWLLESHQAINGAFALASDYLFDGNDFFKPFKDAGFNLALKEYIETDYGKSGLFVSVSIDEDLIHITQDKKSEEKLESTILLLQKGDYKNGKKNLESLLSQYPNNAVVLYNLGMIYSDEGKLDQAIKLLSLTTEKNDEHAHAWTALAVAYTRTNNIDLALKAAHKAVEVGPDDPYVLRTLGTLLTQSGKNTEAISILEKAVRISPYDTIALLALAESLRANNTGENKKRADDLYKLVIDLAPESPQAERAKSRRQEIAYKGFREVGEMRPDAVMYCLDALKIFSRMTEKEIAGVAMETATLGQSGLEVNNPESSYELRTIPGHYSGLNVVCILHTAIQKITPGTDSGFDVQAEYEEALKLFRA